MKFPERDLKTFLTIFVIAISFSCHRQEVKIERAFYYWKNQNYSLEDAELMSIRDQSIQKLYVKFFEVAPDSVLGAIPTAKTELLIGNYFYGYENDSLLSRTMTNLVIVPTIFIRNSVFFNKTAGSLDTLADNICFLAGKYYKNQFGSNSRNYQEIQLDCDWTERTRDNYFYLLQKIKSLSGKSISCTLRLYPYKYSGKMGIPPVDKAVLMCYNLINPLASDNKNSILAIEELRKYLEKGKKYPLHLDFALPLFSWVQVYQNNQFVGIIHPATHELDSIAKPVRPLWSEVIKEQEIGNIYLKIGDRLKREVVKEGMIKDAIILLKENVPWDNNRTIVLFDLDERNLRKFNHETLNSFFADFGR